MTLPAEQKEAITKTVIQRLSTGATEACKDQVARFQKHLQKLVAKGKDKGWGKRSDWPGDANRTYEDIKYYISEYEKYKDVPRKDLEGMVKGFRAGMTIEQATKAFV